MAKTLQEMINIADTEFDRADQRFWRHYRNMEKARKDRIKAEKKRDRYIKKAIEEGPDPIKTKAAAIGTATPWGEKTAKALVERANQSPNVTVRL